MRRSSKGIFDVLAQENLPGLLAFVSACIHDSHDADVVDQRVILAAWEDIEHYDPAREFARWLCGIARNKVLEYYRSIATARRHIRTLPVKSVTAITDEFNHRCTPKTPSDLRHKDFALLAGFRQQRYHVASQNPN